MFKRLNSIALVLAIAGALIIGSIAASTLSAAPVGATSANNGYHVKQHTYNDGKKHHDNDGCKDKPEPTVPVTTVPTTAPPETTTTTTITVPVTTMPPVEKVELSPPPATVTREFPDQSVANTPVVSITPAPMSFTG